MEGEKEARLVKTRGKFMCPPPLDLMYPLLAAKQEETCSPLWRQKNIALVRIPGGAAHPVFCTAALSGPRVILFMSPTSHFYSFEPGAVYTAKSKG